MSALILFGIFFLLLFMNMPIAFALGISSIATILYEGLPLLPVASNLYAATSTFVLLAIPFFILGGKTSYYGKDSGTLYVSSTDYGSPDQPLICLNAIDGTVVSF